MSLAEVVCGNCRHMRVELMEEEYPRCRCRKTKQKRYYKTNKDLHNRYWRIKARNCDKFDSMGPYNEAA